MAIPLRLARAHRWTIVVLPPASVFHDRQLGRGDEPLQRKAGTDRGRFAQGQDTGRLTTIPTCSASATDVGDQHLTAQLQEGTGGDIFNGQFVVLCTIKLNKLQFDRQTIAASGTPAMRSR